MLIIELVGMEINKSKFYKMRICLQKYKRVDQFHNIVQKILKDLN